MPPTRAVRARVGLVPQLSEPRARRGRDDRGAARAGRARGRARLRRRDDERAPRRLRGLPAEPAAARGLPARRDADTVGRRRARCCCRCARRRWSPRRRRGSRRAFPVAVGLGVAAGALAVDFEIMDVPMDDLTARFTAGLEVVAAALRGDAPGPLAADPALAACRDHPIPMLSAAASVTAAPARGARRRRVAVRLARHARTGRELVDAYRDRGRRPGRACWCGGRGSASRRAPTSTARSTCTAATRPRARPRTGAPTRWSSRRRRPTSPARCSTCSARPGADALNLRVHVPGVSAADGARADHAPRRRSAPPAALSGPGQRCASAASSAIAIVPPPSRASSSTVPPCSCDDLVHDREAEPGTRLRAGVVAR